MKPDTPPDYDPKLWFTMAPHCEGKHYLLYTPHTFVGRIGAWCPTKGEVFNVSKAEMDSSSEEAKIWLKGYLAGCEPEAPRTELGTPLECEAPRHQFWLKSVELFAATGSWYSGDRNGEGCKEPLLPSILGTHCQECAKP